jgi:hypothetical protein
VNVRQWQAANAVRSDLEWVSEKHLRPLRDQLTEQLEALPEIHGDTQPAPSWVWQLGPSKRYRAFASSHDHEAVLLAVGEWRERQLLVGGRAVTRLSIRKARAKWLERMGRDGLLLERDDAAVAVMVAVRTEAELEALILGRSTRLARLLDRRLVEVARGETVALDHLMLEA